MKTRIENFYTVAYQWLINYGPKIILALIVFFISQWIIRLLRRWTAKFFLAPKFEQVRPFLEGVIAISLQVILVLILMQILVIQMPIFAAVITAFGLQQDFL